MWSEAKNEEEVEEEAIEESDNEVEDCIVVDAQ